MNQLVYNPYASGLSALLLVLVLLGLGLLLFGVLNSGLTKLGFSSAQAALVLLASVLGSGVNVPVGHIRSTVTLAGPRLVRVNGLLYRIPRHSVLAHDTTVALNLGGAIIPIFICAYLVTRFPRSLPSAFLATIPVAFAVHAFAQLVPGLGVALPAYLPPLLAAMAAIIVTGVTNGGPSDCFVAAYFSGTMGTLIGADLMNLSRIGSLGAPIASIGGAGTFDGVFLTGILAVVLVMIPSSLFRFKPSNPGGGERSISI